MSKSTLKKCKCCQEQSELLNLWDEYCRFGEFVVYGDMMKDCFALSLKKPKNRQEFICQICIRRLGDAVSFKREILAANDLLSALNTSSCIDEKYIKQDATSDTEIDVKTEYLDIEYLLDDDCDNICDALFSDDDKTVTVDVKKDTINNDSMTPYTQEDLDHCIKEIEQNYTSVDDAASMFNIPHTVVKDAWDNLESTTRRRGRPLSDRGTRLREQQLVLNLITDHSNATPFKGYNGRAFECYFCEKSYEYAADLKKHTCKAHKQTKLIINSVLRNGAKMDVTDLSCRLCKTNVNVITEFCDHLKNEHNKQFYSSVLNFLIPFNFNSDELKCVICKEGFLYFKLLNEHMKKHFINYECDLCGTGFITRSTLKSHRLRHENGEFKCDQCPKIFFNKSRVREHQKRVHLKIKRNKCVYCEEKFIDIVKKKQHESDVHGAKKQTFKCQACERVFKSQKSLGGHIKEYHLMIRRHRCYACDKQFSTPLGLKQHMVKHTKSREFICNVCSKGFGRKYTLIEHMRIHTNDRRHICEICNQAFIQKCSLKSHMSSKHRFEYK